MTILFKFGLKIMWETGGGNTRDLHRVQERLEPPLSAFLFSISTAETPFKLLVLNLPSIFSIVSPQHHLKHQALLQALEGVLSFILFPF